MKFGPGGLLAKMVASPLVVRAASGRSARLEKLLAASGELGYPSAIAARSLAVSVVLLALLGPLALVLAATLWVPLGLISLIPLAAYLLPEMRLRDKAAQRREGVEAELPFFSILANVLGGAGVSLYSVFESVSEAEIFGSMKSESLMVRRDVKVFGVDPTSAFERIASVHPSQKFSNFLLGYASKARSGGDLPNYLLGESGILLRELEEKWARYTARVGVVGSLMVTVFGVVPLLLLVVGFFSPAASVFVLALFAFAGMPFLAAALVFMAGRMQPMGEGELAGRGREAAALLFAALVIGFLLHLTWIALAAGLCASFGLYGWSVKKQRVRMRQIDDSLPMLLKDLMEFKRQEYDLGRSVLAIGASARYGPALDQVVGGLTGQLKMGVPLAEAKSEPGTKMSRVVFFVLAQMGHSGGGSVDTLFQLAQYTTKVTEMKKNAQAEMKPYLLLSYITPLLLVFGVTFVGGVLSSFQPRLLAAGLSAGSFGGGASEGLLEVADALIVISAAALGLVGAKIVDLTVRNTSRAMTNVFIAAAAAWAVPALDLLGVLRGGA